jgi:hypothetical protein
MDASFGRKTTPGFSTAILSGPTLAVAAVAVALGIRYFHFIWKYSVNILFFDQWDFLTPLFEERTGVVSLFLRQHGPHREGLGLVADRILYVATGWNTRAEVFLIGGAIFGAMLLALLLKVKLLGQITYTDVVIPFIFLSLVQFETLIGTPNAAYSGIPLFLILLYCLVLLQRRPVLKYTLLLLINFLLIYTGMGIFMGAVTIGILSLECYRRLRHWSTVSFLASAATLVAATGSLASFFINYRFRPAVDCFEFPYRDLMAYPRFMAIMSASFLGPTGPMMLLTVAGIVIVIFSLVVLGIQFVHLATRKSLQDVQLVIAVLLTYGLVFSANTAIGRVCLGPQAAQASRYTTLLVPLFLGLYLFLASLPASALQKIMLVGFVIVLVPGALRLHPAARWFSDGKRAWADCYVRTEDIEYCDQATSFKIYPDPPHTELKRKLDYLKARRLNLFH